MTRDEAVSIFYKIMYPDGARPEQDLKWAQKAIAAYEALGVLKFDEPKKLIDRLWAPKDYATTSTGGPSPAFFRQELQSELDRCGLKLVEKDK